MPALLHPEVLKFLRWRGKLGGSATRDKYGKAHFVRAAKASAKVRRANAEKRRLAA